MPANVLHDLCERQAAARARRDYHHQRFDWALDNLKALGARCPGVACPKVQAAGRALSKASRGEVQEPFMDFADALLECARSESGKDQGEGVERLANQAMNHMRELAHHVDREAKAQREAQLFASAMTLAEAANQDASDPGGVGA